MGGYCNVPNPLLYLLNLTGAGVWLLALVWLVIVLANLAKAATLAIWSPNQWLLPSPVAPYWTRLGKAEHAIYLERIGSNTY
jgi:hypothetical protein